MLVMCYYYEFVIRVLNEILCVFGGLLWFYVAIAKLKIRVFLKELTRSLKKVLQIFSWRCCVFYSIVYVGKSIKVVFFNWWFKCKDERINLGFLRILKNCFDKVIMDSFRNLILKNDYVKNKD